MYAINYFSSIGVYKIGKTSGKWQFIQYYLGGRSLVGVV